MQTEDEQTLQPWEIRTAILTARAVQMDDTADDETLPISEFQRTVLRKVASILRYVTAHIQRAAAAAVAAEQRRHPSEDDQHPDS